MKDTKRKVPDPISNIGAYTQFQRGRYAFARVKEGHISLETGSPLRQPFPAACDLARSNLEGNDDVMNRYFGSNILFESKHYSDFFNRLGIRETITNDNLAPGNGGTQLYVAAVRSLLDEKDVMLVPVPSYGFFLEPALTGKTNIAPVLLRAEDGFKLTPKYLDAEISRINADFMLAGKTLKVSAFLNINPHNPTGVVYNKAEIEALAAVLKKHDIRLVIDDMVYHGLEYGRASTEPTANLAVPMASAKGMFDRTVTIFSLSKAYSMPALRAGLAMGPKQLMRPVRNYIGKETEFVSHISQAAIAGMLSPKYEKDKNDYLEEQAKEFGLKYNLIRLIVNGFKNDAKARAYFNAVTIDDVLEKVYPYATPCIANDEQRKAICSGGMMHIIGKEDMIKRWFTHWLNETQQDSEEFRMFVKLHPTTQKEERAKYFTKMLPQYEAEEAEKAKSYNADMDRKRARLKSQLENRLNGLNALPIADAGFFMIIDVTALKGKSLKRKYWSAHQLSDATHISHALVDEGVSMIPGEAMGYYGDKLLLRLSFSPPLEDILTGLDRVRSMLGKVRDMPLVRESKSQAASR